MDMDGKVSNLLDVMGVDGGESSHGPGNPVCHDHLHTPTSRRRALMLSTFQCLLHVSISDNFLFVF